MAGHEMAQTVAYLVTSLGAGFAAWKVVRELLFWKRRSLREDYRFAQEFLSAYQRQELHPLALDLGFKALSGCPDVSAAEVAYLIDFENPMVAVRKFVASRAWVRFQPLLHPRQRVAFKHRWRSRRIRVALKWSLIGSYGVCFALAFAPVFLVITERIAGRTGLALFLLTAVTFIPLAVLSAKAGAGLIAAEALIHQAQTRAIAEMAVK